jgi:hypothetical protein
MGLEPVRRPDPVFTGVSKGVGDDCIHGTGDIVHLRTGGPQMYDVPLRAPRTVGKPASKAAGQATWPPYYLSKNGKMGEFTRTRTTCGLA